MQEDFPKFLITDEDHEPYEEFPNQCISYEEIEGEPGEQNRGFKNKGTQEIFSEDESQINLNQTEFVISIQSEDESGHEDTRENEHTLRVLNGKEEHKVKSECYEWEKLMDDKLKLVEEEFSNFNPYNTKEAQDSVKGKIREYMRNRALGNVGTSNLDVGKQESEHVVNAFIEKLRENLIRERECVSVAVECVKTDFIPDCQQVPAITSHVDIIPDCQKVPAMISKTKKVFSECIPDCQRVTAILTEDNNTPQNSTGRSKKIYGCAMKTLQPKTGILSVIDLEDYDTIEEAVHAIVLVRRFFIRWRKATGFIKNYKSKIAEFVN
jgi:hypothetical protein